MGKFASLGWLLLYLISTGSYAQVQSYAIKLAPFSTHANDEFSPVFYKEGIVICSNLRDNSLAGYQDEQNRLFKLFYISKGNMERWRFPKLLARELTTGFNDGPATFNNNGTVVYYSRNNSIEKSMKNIADPSNKLGIYSAELINGNWSDIRPFAYNNHLYTLTTPALTPDGQRLFFSSDIPGGMGGMDLYYCNWHTNGWGEPINLGPVINTSKNESFPFADKTGRIFFSSDGLPGLGGKDLFFTQEDKGEWIVPINLDSAINSTADDFGLVLDSTLRSGYFSSNRLKTDDIFSFTRTVEEFSDCDTIKETNYCFTFYDERHQLIDSLHALYKWDFGNGLVRAGSEVKHCFPGPGEYSVRLDIIDEITGDTIAEQFEYVVKLDPAEQAHINSNFVGLTGQPLSFDALSSNIKDFTVSDYWWDFGDGFEPGGALMRYAYPNHGKYTVRLGLVSIINSAWKIQKTCVTKDIRIYDTLKELTVNKLNTDHQNNGMQIACYLTDDLSEKQKQKIDIILEKRDWLVSFDQYGVLPDSNTFLDEVAGILKEEPEIKLEIVVHLKDINNQESALKISENYAQELAFYLKNKETDILAIRSKGLGLSGSYIKSHLQYNESMEGIIEFIFMKK